MSNNVDPSDVTWGRLGNEYLDVMIYPKMIYPKMIYPKINSDDSFIAKVKVLKNRKLDAKSTVPINYDFHNCNFKEVKN